MKKPKYPGQLIQEAAKKAAKGVKKVAGKVAKGVKKVAKKAKGMAAAV